KIISQLYASSISSLPIFQHFLRKSGDKGIRRLVKEQCDYLVKIPISSKVESLNVSNAAAILFYLTSLIR
ncbi:MAG: hypothetical protein LN575_06010, partial [Rickettsia endosymbiont of Gnoriste bilineata]|nr:hypothetical protein [Rickettsia endosymbiont of Gnoriste bilineata]